MSNPLRTNTHGERARRIETRLVRFDQCPDDPFRPSATPIYQTATFEQESALEFGRFDYSRSGNPTREVLETQLASLASGSRALCYASGLAAISAVVDLLSPGDEILAHDDLYGGTYRLFSGLAERRGVRVRYADLSASTTVGDSHWRESVAERTRLIYAETPTNPLQHVCDIGALSALARRAGARLCIDNTAMSPYLQKPLELGADIVLESATKYLCGHSDVTAGVVTVRDGPLARTLAFNQNATGSALAPFDSFLLLRGLKTLAIRIDAQQRNARRVASFLCRHPAVARVHYVGLPSHPGSVLHSSQSRGPGSVVSFETGRLETSRRIVESLRCFGIAVSFGGIGSTASLPCRMSHASIPPGERRRHELPEDLVRLSIGIESADDLIDDLGQALDGCGTGRALPRAAGAERASVEEGAPCR